MRIKEKSLEVTLFVDVLTFDWHWTIFEITSTIPRRLFSDNNKIELTVFKRPRTISREEKTRVIYDRKFYVHYKYGFHKLVFELQGY